MNDKESVMPSHVADAHGAHVTASPTRVLVADDDPASCRFLSDGLQRLGARVLPCADGIAALERASGERFDLLLLDCRMPGAGALQILGQLRHDESAQSTAAVAVATTADLHPTERQPLLAVGFSEILLKPCTLLDLQRVLRLTHIDPHSPAMLDDDAALVATGDATTMHALRRLLREELVVLAQQLDQALVDRAEFSERLHRLRSSCGFCGAVMLAERARALQRELTSVQVRNTCITSFRSTLVSTLQELDN
jgi:two-component system OmpR family response regulator